MRRLHLSRARLALGRYPSARILVPGHGAVSGASALAWTERRIREKGPVTRHGGE